MLWLVIMFLLIIFTAVFVLILNLCRLYICVCCKDPETGVMTTPLLRNEFCSNSYTTSLAPNEHCVNGYQTVVSSAPLRSSELVENLCALHTPARSGKPPDGPPPSYAEVAGQESQGSHNTSFSEAIIYTV